MFGALGFAALPRELEAAEDEDEDGEGLPSLHKAALDR